MENEQKPNNSNSNITFLILGIIFLFIPVVSFLGVIFIIIYFTTSTSKNGNFVEDIKRDLKDVETEIDDIKKEIKYVVEDEEVTKQEEELYKQIEEEIKKGNIEPEQIEFKDTQVEEQKGTTFNGGAIDKKGFGNNNDGPIKYY